MGNAVCDLELVIHSCQAAYRVTGTRLIDDEIVPATNKKRQGDKFLHTTKVISNKGYQLDSAVKNEASSGLNAICLVPKDKEDNTLPIVISYRGTVTTKDWVSNDSIRRTGLAEQAMRDDAYRFYREMKHAHPERQILLTGHSLGGNLAQDVALRACKEKGEYNLVRTISTAPIRNHQYDEVAKEHPSLIDNFVHYRLTGDVISKMAVNQSYGDIHQFDGGQYKKQLMSPHMLYAVNDILPKSVKNLAIGEAHKEITLPLETTRLIEKLQAVSHSYTCKVQRQWFNLFRWGPDNVKSMQAAVAQVTRLLQSGADNNLVIRRLETLERELKGKEAKALGKLLRADARRYLLPHEIKEALAPVSFQESIYQSFKHMYQALVGSKPEDERIDKRKTDDNGDNPSP